MRIVAISMIRNESDILEAFVRYNLNFVDAMIILENASDDSSREILVNLEREGLPIVLIDDPELKYNQSDKMTDLALSVSEVYNPDWIIPIDVDEFLVLEDKSELRGILSLLNPNSVGVFPWKTYVPDPDDDAGEPNVLKRILHRRKDDTGEHYNVVIPQSIIRSGKFVICQGNHAVLMDDGKTRFDHFLLPSIKMAHFPIRTNEQILNKAFVGWLGYLCDPERKEGTGYHKREMYERFMSNTFISPIELKNMAVKYLCQNYDVSEEIIYEPVDVPANVEIKYPQLMQATPLHIVTKAAERLAVNLSKKSALAVPSSSSDQNNRSQLIIGRHGGWSSQFHGSRMNCDIPPFRYIYDVFQPTSILDIGCGMGTYIGKFREWGVGDVAGVEATDMGDAFKVPGALKVHNMEEPLDLGRKFDIVISVEVVEHIGEQYELNFIESISKHAERFILFSAAQPGQSGMGHINLKPAKHWINVLNNLGWTVLTFHSLAFRLLANFSWFKRNPLVFARKGWEDSYDLSDEFNVNDVLRHKGDPNEWRSQIPGTYETTLLGRKIDGSWSDDDPAKVLLGIDQDLVSLKVKKAIVNFNLGDYQYSLSNLKDALKINQSTGNKMEPRVTDLIVQLANKFEEDKDIKSANSILAIINDYKDVLDD